jgi:hypothetical protein
MGAHLNAVRFLLGHILLSADQIRLEQGTQLSGDDCFREEGKNVEINELTAFLEQ